MKPRMPRMREASKRIGNFAWAKKPQLAVFVLVVAIAAALVLAIWLLPEILTRTTRPMTGKELLEAKNSVRVTLLQAIGGAVLAGGLYFTSRTLQLNREGHITERYTKSIDLLGSDAIDVRIGGVFALERLARDSRIDSGTISGVLIAFIRNRTSKQGIPWTHPSEDPVDSDVQAALTVLGRWSGEKAERIDLTGCGLSEARLYDGNWAGAVFNYSLMRGVGFSDSDLTNADLSFSKVTQGGFLRVKANGMHFVRTSIQGWFCEADLRNADFAFSDVSGSDFGERRTASGALLSSAANLTGADFSFAKLDGTILEGCDLRSTVGISQAQFAKAITSSTTLPPNEWAEDPDEVGPEADVPPNFRDH